jgi:hypothetical protein
VLWKTLAWQINRERQRTLLKQKTWMSSPPGRKMKFAHSLCRVPVGAVIVGTILVCTKNSSAAVDLGFNQVFGAGSVASASPTTPWMTATFSDNGDGTVDLALSNPDLTGIESVSELFFDFASPHVSVQSLSFSIVGKSGSFKAPTFAEENNGFKAAGVGGKYDFTISFTPGANVAKTFGAGDTLILKISSRRGAIDAADFMSLSAGGRSDFYAAASVQNTPDNSGCGSAWIGANLLDSTSVPEPPIGVAGGLSALGVAAVALCRNERRKQ